MVSSNPIGVRTEHSSRVVAMSVKDGAERIRCDTMEIGENVEFQPQIQESVDAL